MTSKYFSQNAIKGLNRVGDIIIPQTDEFPSFSEYDCVTHVDDLLNYMPESDVSTLNSVLGIFAFLPKGALVQIVNLMTNSPDSQNALAPLFRQLNIGLRGILFSLYYSRKAGPDYSGKDPADIIDYQVNRVID